MMVDLHNFHMKLEFSPIPHSFLTTNLIDEDLITLCKNTLFQKYLSVRPENVNRFYLKPLNIPNNGIWYSSQTSGKNTTKIVSAMCVKAGFVGNFSSHSLRTTCATRLFQSGIEEQLVSSVTGTHQQCN